MPSCIIYSNTRLKFQLKPQLPLQTYDDAMDDAAAASGVEGTT